MTRFLSFTSMLLALSTPAFALQAGDPAPSFEAKNQDGKLIRSASLKGKPIAIFFYPKDFTSGCTEQACQFRDSYGAFKKEGAVVLGISRQDEKSHQAFIKEHKLPYDLLVDEDGKLGKLFGVGSMFFGLSSRSSILIGANGKVLRFYESANPKTNAKDMLEDLRAAPKAAPAKP